MLTRILAGLHNAEDVLLHSPAELNRKLRYTRVEAVQDLIKAVSKGIVPQTSTLLEIVNAEAGPSRPTRTNGTPRRSTDDDQDADEAEDEDEAELGKWTTGNCIRTGDKEFDLALGGGLRVGTLTEITGERYASLCVSAFDVLTRIPVRPVNPISPSRSH